MLLISAALLLGMQTAPDAPVQIAIKTSGENCLTLVDGAVVDQQGLEIRAKGWARSGRAVVLSGDVNAPYRCIGGLIFALQRAGFGSNFAADFSPGFQMRFSAVIKLGATSNCEIMINGTPANFPEYERLAAEWGRNQPAIHFQPNPDVQYECVERMLGVLTKHNTTKLGFVGNELNAVPEGSE